MTITIDWENKVIESTEDISDLPVFKDTIRDFEDDVEGILYPVIITYKRLDIGGGAYFHSVELVNGYQLKFSIPGNYAIVGNLGGNIIPVAGVYVERKTSAAFATTQAGSGIEGEVEPGIDAIQALRILLATAVGKTTIVDHGGGEATVTFRDTNDTKNRIIGEMTGSERTDVTLDVDP